MKRWIVQTCLEGNCSQPESLTIWITIQVQLLQNHLFIGQGCHLFSILMLRTVGRLQFCHKSRNQEQNQIRFHASLITTQMYLLPHSSSISEQTVVHSQLILPKRQWVDRSASRSINSFCRDSRFFLIHTSHVKVRTSCVRQLKIDI